MADPKKAKVAESGTGSKPIVNAPASIRSGPTPTPKTNTQAVSAFSIEPWDFNVPSNVYTALSSKPNQNLLHPHPEIELLRCKELRTLHSFYERSCQDSLKISSPRGSFNRWLMEPLLQTADRRVDPVLPYCPDVVSVVEPEEYMRKHIDTKNHDGKVFSVSLFKDILRDVPVELVSPRFTVEALRQLTKFAQASIQATEGSTIEVRNRVKTECDRIVQWVKEQYTTQTQNVTSDTLVVCGEKMNQLKGSIFPLVVEATKSKVESICVVMSSKSSQMAMNIRSAHLKLFSTPPLINTIPNSSLELEMGRHKARAAICGEFEFRKDTARSGMMLRDDQYFIEYKEDIVRISNIYMKKLLHLYEMHTGRPYGCIKFISRVYCLLKRYDGFSNDFKLCQTTQGSLPTPVSEFLQKEFEVSFECFASPFNTYFANYCSAFPDTDGYFGSFGTFLEFYPTAGSFQAFPPLSPDLIPVSITHIELLLSNTQQPMSFILFLPEFESWSREHAQWATRIRNSDWYRTEANLPRNLHEFRCGDMHRYQPCNRDRTIRSQGHTSVFWLQNTAGFEAWPPTSSQLQRLTDLFRPGRKRKRDIGEMELNADNGKGK